MERIRRGAYIQRAHLAVDRAAWHVRQAGIDPAGKPNLYAVYRYADKGHSPTWTRYAGREVVDLADVASRVAACEGAWRHTLRLAPAGTLGALAQPLRCGLHRWCPHCAGAVAQGRAHRIRDALRGAVGDGEVGSAVLVTLTQRQRAGEDFAAATSRLRDALRRLVSPGSQARTWRTWWADAVAGHAWSTEVTRGWRGRTDGAPRPSWRACWYHPHVHCVVALAPGVDPAEAARRIGERWEALTAAASGEGWGWDPVASGGIAADRSRWDRGGWWRPIDLADDELGEVFQATKYLVKPSDLEGPEVLEVATWARGQRWHGAGGCLRVAAADVDDGGQLAGDETTRPDPGRALASPWVSPVADPAEERAELSWPILAADVPAVLAAIARESGTAVPVELDGYGGTSGCGELEPSREVLVGLAAGLPCALPSGAPIPRLEPTEDGWRVRARLSWVRAREAAADAAVAAADLARAVVDVERTLQARGELAQRRRTTAAARHVYQVRWTEGRAAAAAVLADDWTADAWPVVARVDPDGIPY